MALKETALGEGILQFGSVARRVISFSIILVGLYFFLFVSAPRISGQEASANTSEKPELAEKDSQLPSDASGASSASGSSADVAGESTSSADSKIDMPSEESRKNRVTATEEKHSDSSANPTTDGVDGSPQDSASLNGIDARLKDLLSLATDYTTKIGKREMPGYWGLVDLVMDKSVAELAKNARRNPRYNDFYSNPSKHRGDLVSTTLHLRRVISYPVDPALGHKATELYELWGWTDESKAWVYCVVTPKLPPGFPKDGDFNRDIEVAGYFFKMQGYQPGSAAPNAKNLIAPLIIGRVDEVRKPEVPLAQFNNLTMLFVGVFALLFFLRLMLRLRASVSSIGQSHIDVRRRLRRERPEVLDELPDIERPNDSEKVEAKEDQPEDKPPF
ncbi:MAG: hypothetical protein RLY14_2177 [Planctomycetota bacterium]